MRVVGRGQGKPRARLEAIEPLVDPALFLDPKSPAVQGLLLEAYRRLPRKPANQNSSGQKSATGDVLGALQKLGKQGKGK